MSIERGYPLIRQRACTCGGDFHLSTRTAATLEEARALLAEHGRKTTAETIGPSDLPLLEWRYQCRDAPIGDRPGFRPEGCGCGALRIENGKGHPVYSRGAYHVRVWNAAP